MDKVKDRLKLIEIIDYYDGPLLIKAENENNETYIGKLIDNKNEQFLFVEVLNEKLLLYYENKIGLRELILERPSKKWFKGSFLDKENILIEEKFLEEKIPEKHIPLE